MLRTRTNALMLGLSVACASKSTLAPSVACAQEFADASNPIVACGQGVILRFSDLRREAALLSRAKRETLLSLEARRKWLDELIAQTLLENEGRRRGLDQSVEVQVEGKALSIELMRVTAEYAERKRTIHATDADVLAYYAKYRDLYDRPRQRRVYHTSCTSQSLCEQLADRVRNTPTASLFSYLAWRYGADAVDRDAGGNLGWVSENDSGVELAVRQAAFVVDPLPGVAGPFSANDRWHVVLVEEWREARHDPAEAVWEEIKRHAEHAMWAKTVTEMGDALVATKSASVALERLDRVHIQLPKDSLQP